MVNYISVIKFILYVSNFCYYIIRYWASGNFEKGVVVVDEIMYHIGEWWYSLQGEILRTEVKYLGGGLV